MWPAIGRFLYGLGSTAVSGAKSALSNPLTYTNMGLFSFLTGGDRRARKSNERMTRETNEANVQMNDATNAANLRMTQETNAANKAINQANIDYSREAWNNQVAYNWDMWNATNEYNSAPEQMKRIQQAGLNPYMMMSGGSAGTASSSPVSLANQPEQIPMQAAQYKAGHVEPYIQPVGTTADNLNALVGAITGSFNAEKMQAEAQGQRLSNDSYAVRLASELAKQAAETHDTELGADIKQFSRDMMFNLKDTLYQKTRYETSALESQIGLMNSQIALNNANASLAAANEDNITFTQMLQTQQYALDYYYKHAQGNLFSAQAADLAVQKAIHEIERDNKFRFTDAQKTALASLTVDDLRQRVNVNRYSAEEQYLTNEGLKGLTPWMRTNIGSSAVLSAGGAINNLIDFSKGFLGKKPFKVKGFR